MEPEYSSALPDQELVIPEFKAIDTVVAILDNRFRIPGTNIRFGLDFLIGLVPTAGDILSFMISGLLVIAMARRGASGQVVAKMLGNIALDTTVGAVPILGDIFDLFYKSNLRNYNLLKEHYTEGTNQGSIWKVIIPLIIALFLLFFLMVYLVYLIVSWFFGLF